jgi:hypothetical protein
MVATIRRLYAFVKNIINMRNTPFTVDKKSNIGECLNFLILTYSALPKIIVSASTENNDFFTYSYIGLYVIFIKSDEATYGISAISNHDEINLDAKTNDELFLKIEIVTPDFFSTVLLLQSKSHVAITINDMINKLDVKISKMFRVVIVNSNGVIMQANNLHSPKINSRLPEKLRNLSLLDTSLIQIVNIIDTTENGTPTVRVAKKIIDIYLK